MTKEIKRMKLTKDFAFKQFFKSNDKVLISMLKSFLPIEEDILDIEFIDLKQMDSGDESTPATTAQTPKLHIEDSTLQGETKELKDAKLDLYIRLSNGKRVNVEMQVLSRTALLQRMLFYWGKLYIGGLKKGEKHDKLTTTYSLIFTDFTVFDHPEETDYFHSACIRLNNFPHRLVCEYLHLVVVELNKLPNLLLLSANPKFARTTNPC